MSAAPWYRWQGSDLVLELRVQPKATRDEVAGVHDGRLKVRITAPPADGKANAHLLGFLAKAFGIPKSRVELLSGQQGRDKRVCIRSPRRLPRWLGEA